MGIWFFLFGLIIGSFLNVCIYRIPIGESIVYPPSFCPNCKARIKWYDNIPVVSYVILSGRCRNCGSKISLVYPIVELTSGILTVLVYLKFGLTLNTVFYLIFSYMLIVASFVDFAHYTIPDRVSIGLIVVGLVYGVVLGKFIFSLFGFAFGFVLLYLIAVFGKFLFKKEAMGGGDIKLIGGIGAFLGFKGVLFTLFFASLIGSIAGIILILFKKQQISSKLPFGPYLSLAALLYMFVGEYIITAIYG